jgi:hypothetical protein
VTTRGRFGEGRTLGEEGWTMKSARNGGDRRNIATHVSIFGRYGTYLSHFS